MAAKPTLRSLAVLLALLAAGCRTDEPGPAHQEGNGEPRRGGTVVTGWTAEPGGVNELIVPSSQVTNELLFRVFLHLVEEQPDFQDHPPTFEPQIAASYEWSDDHKILTFHLRKGAVWSDGVPITAEDVRWTWQAQTNADVLWDNAEAKDYISDVEVVDPYTVRFHFSRVYATQLLDANEGVILPKHAWEKIPFTQWRQSGDWFKNHIVVSGPFTIASWVPQQQIVMARNERYYDKRFPYLDRVVMRIVSDQASAFTQLLSGDIDFMPQIAPGDAPRVKADPDLELLAYWFNVYVTAGWNNEHPLFRDPEVRRALTLGIDRQTIVETLLGSYGRIADSPILTMVWAHDDSIQPLPYDPAEARRILAAKGWRDSDGDGVLDKDGKPFAFELISNAGNQARADAAVMIQDQLKKVGIRVEPLQVEFNTLVDQTNEGRFAAAMLGFTMDTSLDLTAQLHSESIGGNGSNYTRFRNPEVDRLLDLSMSQKDILEAKPYFDQIQQIVHREQPMTFLWEPQRLSGASKRLRNVKPTVAFTFFNLEEWWAEPKP